VLTSSNYTTIVHYRISDKNTNPNTATGSRSSSSKKTGVVRNVSTSTSATNGQQEETDQNFRPVYVHHVSRIVLEHLQNNQNGWLTERGLDRNLSIRANGTFVLKFPAPPGYDSGRIWTSYDSHRKQHWLSVYRNKLAVRFLLKDHERAAIALQQRQQLRNGKLTVSDYHALSVEKIQMAVNEMINTVEQMEPKQQQQQQHPENMKPSTTSP
jgi:hypothetical protein